MELLCQKKDIKIWNARNFMKKMFKKPIEYTELM